MKAEEFKWTTRDDKNLIGQIWRAENPSGKVIILVHGLGEHCMRYERWAGMLNAEGHSVISFDQRGHGKSDGKRGHAPSLDVLLDDISHVYDVCETGFPDYIKILYGHSMGGNLALNYMIRRKPPVSGLVITSPWLKLFKQPDRPTMIFTNVLKNLYPSLCLSNRLKPEQISHDPEVVRNYINDPLVHDRISVWLFCELYKSGIYAMNNIYKINCPLLLMHGGADTITSAKASETYTMNTHNKIIFKLWENQSHELHNELIYKDVFDYLVDWIAKYT